MKRFILLVLLLFFALPCFAQDPDGIIGRTSIAELKELPGTSMYEGLFAVVVLDQDETYGSIVLHYVARESGTTESLLEVVAPSVAPGDWRWHRIKIYTAINDLDIMATGSSPAVADTAKLSHQTSDSTYHENTGESSILAKDTEGNIVVVGRKFQPQQVTFVSPNTFPTGTRDSFPVFTNTTNFTMQLARIFCTATSATSIVFKSTTDWNNATILNTIGTVTINNAMTGSRYYGNTTSFTNAFLGAGKTMVLDFHDTDEVENGHCFFEGWYDAS